VKFVLFVVLSVFLVSEAVQITSPETATFEYLNKTITIEKEYDEAKGTIALKTSTGEDVVALERQNEAEFRKRYGALSHEMVYKHKNGLLKDPIKVEIVLRHNDVPLIDKTLPHLSEDYKHRNYINLLAPQVDILKYIRDKQLVPFDKIDTNNYVVRVNDSWAKLSALAFDSDVVHINEFRVSEPASYPQYDLVTESYNTGTMTLLGSGVCCATYERGLSNAYLSCIELTRITADHGVAPASADLHSEGCFHFMKWTSPNCYTHHYNYGLYTPYYNTAGIQWMQDHLIASVSLSYHRDYSLPTDAEQVLMDWFVNQYPYTMFCNCTGNHGFNYVSGWGAYNGLSIGNVRCDTDHHYCFPSDLCTETTNPANRYSSSYTDREMPYIVAPGITPVTGIGMEASCVEALYCGTSYSAPITSGIVANLKSHSSYWWEWPERVRVALLVSAQNVDGGEWSQFVDGRDGAGVISGYDAELFVRNATHVNQDGDSATTSCVSGIYGGSWYQSGASNHSFWCLVPTTKPAGKHLRIVLTWNSNANTSTNTNDLTDMDLVAFPNNHLKVCVSKNSNNEIINIASNDANLVSGQIFRIKVINTTNRIPVGSLTYYAVGWSWVVDQAN